MIALVGFMGAGKTTIGRLVAERLGLPFVDTDLAIEQRERRAVREIFAADGEEGFRDVEQAVVAEVLAGPVAVVSLGGGACVRQATRALLRRHTTVHLDVSFAEARDRTRGDVYRPMLARPDLAELHAARRLVYEDVARFTVATDGQRAEGIALEVLDAVTGTEGILVAPPGGSYRVHVRPGLLDDVGDLLATDARQVLVVGPQDSADVGAVAGALAARGRTVAVVGTPAGAAARTLAAFERVAAAAAELALHRNDLVVGVGDEAVGDVAGFLAATYNRGTPLALVPRSLEAQADSAIGGKSALDLPLGRGLLGAVHQPVVVLSDPVGVTPATDLRFAAGLAEAVKHALVADPDDLGPLVEQAPAVLAGDPEALAVLVRRSVSTKARVVTEDEREASGRLHLNYGHTFAHALEHVLGGRAVDAVDALPLGLMAAAHLARRLGLLDDAGVDLHRTTLRAFGLPTARRLEFDDLLPALLRDKKYRDGSRFVLLHGPGRPEAGVPADDAALRAALDDLAEDL